MNSPATILFGIATIPAILGLIDVFKDIGMPSKFSPAAAVLLGVAGVVAQYYARDVQVIQYIVTGIALGLSSVGLYTTATNVGIKAVLLDKQIPASPILPATSTTEQGGNIVVPPASPPV